MNVAYRWRRALTDDGGEPVVGWWDQIRPRRLGWVTAREGELLVGFVNLAALAD